MKVRFCSVTYKVNTVQNDYTKLCRASKGNS